MVPKTDDLLLSTLMETSPDFIFIKDRQSRFVKVNQPMAKQLLGIAHPNDAIGKTDFDLFPGKEKDAQRFYDEELEIMATGVPVVYRKWSVPNLVTGETMWVSESKYPIVDQDGTTIGLLGISRDITARREAELERDKLTNQLQSVIDVTAMVNSILDPQPLMQKIVDSLEDRFGFYYVGLFMVSQRERIYERPGEYAYLQAATGEAGQKMMKQRHKLKVGPGSLVGQCIATGEARIVPNIKNVEGRFAHPLLPDARSEMVLPLTGREETLGAISVQSRQENAFTEQYLSVFGVLASLLATAIENAHLYKKIDDELEKVKADLKRYVQASWNSYLRDK
jgi:PAS domain S-box-containing protein